MPPWPPADGCGTFRDSRRLSAVEVATFAAWKDAGAPAGKPSDAPATLTPQATSPGVPSATLDPGAAYRANPAVIDDYHCFLVDPGLYPVRDPARFAIHPGAPTSVHHVLLFAVAPDLLAAAEAKDAAEPGVGWTCFGATGIGTTAATAPPTIGGWVPGSGASAFPPADRHHPRGGHARDHAGPLQHARAARRPRSHHRRPLLRERAGREAGSRAAARQQHLRDRARRCRRR